MKTLAAHQIAAGPEPIGVTPEGDTGARVLRLPPPLLYAIPMAVGLAMNRVLPLSLDVPGSGAVGAVLMGAGLAIAAAGVGTFVRHHTTVVPHHSVSTLVTGGVFRFSRNPMYTGLAVAYVGASLLAHSWWPLALLPTALIAIRRLVIEPEERYLCAQFGVRYDAYRARVRRWL